MKETKAALKENKKNGASERVICSDVIFRYLSRFIPQLSHAVLHDEKGLLGDLDFHVNGWVSPKDLARIAAIHTPDLFIMMPIHDDVDEELEKAELDVLP